MEREVQVGQLVAGKYRIQQMLGRGGMGVVMAALHEQLNQHVALKFLTDDAYQQPEAVARFLREARSAVQIQSEHVARVMDVGTLESGAPYIVMEYLRGLDLKEVSTRRGPLPISEAVDFVLQACDAVAEAHSLGIIHRDLKPSNLFLTERPDGSPMVKVLDFGISKALNGGGRGGETSKQQMTASAAIMGSPQYMSPEQIRSSKNVDARADVWALGTILHELVAGCPAYVADTVPGLLAMIVADAPPPLSSVRHDAPLELEAIILRCLEKNRDQRFANVAEFARALERFASPEVRPLVRRIARVLGDNGGSSQSYRSIVPGLATQHEPVNQTHNTWARTGRVSEQGAQPPFFARPTVQLGAGLGLVGVGMLAAWFFFAAPRPIATGVPGQTTMTTVKTSPKPPEVKTAADTAGRDPLPIAPTIVRPVREPDPPIRPALPDPPTTTAAPSALEDDDPRAPHNFRDDDTVYPSANAKKKELAAAQRHPRPKPRPAAPVEPTHDDAYDVSPAAPPKKSNPLDLFDDTK